jgi:hypothetical protein
VPLNNTQTLKGKYISETMRWVPLTFREQQTALPGYRLEKRDLTIHRAFKMTCIRQTLTQNPGVEDPQHMCQVVHQSIQPSLSPPEYWSLSEIPDYRTTVEW